MISIETMARFRRLKKIFKRSISIFLSIVLFPVFMSLLFFALLVAMASLALVDIDKNISSWGKDD